MDDFQKEMFDIFVFETNGFLEDLESILMQAETEEGDITDAVPEIFRIMHTLKSSAAMMGLDNISKLAHSMEDLFFFIREKHPTQIDKRKLTDIVLAGVDYIKRNMEPDIDEDPTPTMAIITDYLHTLEAANTAGTPEASTHKEASGDPAPSCDSLPPAQEASSPTEDLEPPCVLKVSFKPSCAMIDLRAFEITTKLGRIQEGIVAIPGDDDPNAEEILAKEGLYLSLPSSHQVDRILRQLTASPFVASAKKVDAGEKPPPRRKPKKAPPLSAVLPINSKVNSVAPSVRPTRESSQPRSESGYMGIDVRKLDNLINLSGEIIISSMGATHAFETGDRDQARSALESLHHLILDMQDKTLSLRMISLRDTFHKLNRAARDASSKLHKQVSFSMSGESTAVDRSVIDHVFSPLMHILRNSIDHGIESAEEREAAGKPPSGSVHLSAAIESGQAVLSVTDDGRGIDPDVILSKALANGLITEAQARSMTNEEINGLIFLPGFSTKNEVSEYSGRGVGMDVVNESVQKLNGKTIVTSKKGEGTKTEIRIPLSMAIMDALIVRAGDEVCAVPLSVIKEAFEPTEGSIRQANAQDVILHGDTCFPIIRLTDMLADTPAPYDEGLMLLVEAEGTQCVLQISEALEQLSVVVKPAPTLLKHVHGIYGYTILGDGNVCLIIDAAGLIQHYIRR